MAVASGIFSPAYALSGLSRVRVIRVAEVPEISLDGGVWLDVEYSYDFRDLLAPPEALFIGHIGAARGDVGPGDSAAVGSCRYLTSASGIAFRERLPSGKLGRLLQPEINLESAKAHFEQEHAESQPGSSAVDEELKYARLKYALGHDDKALALYSDVLSCNIDPCNLEARIFKAKCFENLRRLDEAASVYRYMLAKSGWFGMDVLQFVQYSLARLARKRGDLAEAKAWYDAAPPMGRAAPCRACELLDPPPSLQHDLVPSLRPAGGTIVEAARNPHESALTTKQRQTTLDFDIGIKGGGQVSTLKRSGQNGYMALLSTGGSADSDGTLQEILTHVDDPLTLKYGSLPDGVTFNNLIQFLGGTWALPRNALASQDTQGLWCFGWTAISISGLPADVSAIVGLTCYNPSPSSSSRTFRYRFHYGFRPHGGGYSIDAFALASDAFKDAATDFTRAVDAVLKA